MNRTEENSQSTQSGKTKKNLHKEFIFEITPSPSTGGKLFVDTYVSVEELGVCEGGGALWVPQK